MTCISANILSWNIFNSVLCINLCHPGEAASNPNLYTDMLSNCAASYSLRVESEHTVDNITQITNVAQFSERVVGLTVSLQ